MMLPLKTVVVICLVCAMAGAVGLYLLASAVSAQGPFGGRRKGPA